MFYWNKGESFVDYEDKSPLFDRRLSLAESMNNHQKVSESYVSKQQENLLEYYRLVIIIIKFYVV